MRLAILLCGVLPGIVSLGLGWWGQERLLFDASGLPAAGYALIVIAIHAIALASIAGGLLVLFSPPMGRVAMLASAVGWLVIVALLGGGLNLPVAGLILVSAAGGVLAYFPNVQTPAFRVERVSGGRSSAPWPSALAKPVRADRRPGNRAPEPIPRPVPEDHSKPFVPPAGLRFDSFPAAETRTAPPSYGGPQTYPLKARRKSKRGRRGSPLAAAAIIVLVVGVPVLVLFGGQLRGWFDTLPVSRTSVAPDRAAEAAAKPAETAPRLRAEPARSRPADPALAVLPMPSSTAPDPLVIAPLTPQVADAPPSSAPIAAVANQPAGVTPSAYCASQTNSDSPQGSKIEAGLQELTLAAREAARLPDGDVRWRCMDGMVWTCVQPAGGTACDKLPDAVDRVMFCAAHPDAQAIQGPGGAWSCDGFTPVVTAAQLKAADRRGFDRSAWRKMSPG